MEKFWPVWVMVVATFAQVYGNIEIEPFSTLAHGLRSGPIYIVNDTTFFITKLYYDGKGPDAHFWTGRGKGGPDVNGTLVPDEKNSRESLAAYNGQDVYITLPNNLTVNDVDYIGMWCIKFTQNFGHTLVKSRRQPSNGSVNNPAFDNLQKFFTLYPKCCPIGNVKTDVGCSQNPVIAPPIKVYDGNETYFDDEPLKDVTLMADVHQPPCEFKMFTLDQTEAFYLTMGVVLCNDGEIITRDRFCIDTHETFNEDNNHLGWEQTIFVCFPDAHFPDILNSLFAGCIYLSAVFLIITSLIFIFITEARDTRGFNVVGYTIFMALSFIFLATARLLHVSGTQCVVFGFIYQFLLVSSFTWLFCLTFETYYRVTHYTKPRKPKRFYIYSGCSVGVPVLAVIISLFINNSLPQHFSKPTLGYEPCWFRSDKKVIFYYVPIGTSIILNAIFALITWRKIKYTDKYGNDNWTIVKKNLKNVFRSCYLLLIIMSICWAAEVVSHFFETRNGFWVAIDIIDSLQGLFVFLIFIMHNPVIDILRRYFPKIFKPKSEPIEYETRLMFNRTTIEVPVQHLEALTRNRRSDSDENLNN